MQTNKEIERKWLINGFPENLKLLREHTMEQAYISIDPEVRIRRQSQAGGSTIHFLTIKSNGDLVRDEVEVRISKAQYETLLNMAGVTPIVKEHKVYETDSGEEIECSKVDPNTDYEFMYAEIEFKDEDHAKNFKELNFFTKEVTSDSSYKMKNYWKRTRLDEKVDTKDESCDGCEHKGECDALNKSLERMGPFGAYIKDMIASGKMNVIHINGPKDETNPEDTDNGENESEEMDFCDILSFIASHTGMIHEHLDEFGFNERQLSEIEGIVHREAEAMMASFRPASIDWRPYNRAAEAAMVTSKIGKIKTGMKKKKVKKLVRKEIKRFYESKRLYNLIHRAGMQEANKATLALRTTIGDEFSRLEYRLTKVIARKFEDYVRKNSRDTQGQEDTSKDTADQAE